jgi:hypothetical protein
MTHESTRRSFKLSWAIGLALAASTLAQTAAAAEPPVRDQWYLDPPSSASAPAISVQFRDRWYLDDTTPYTLQARSHRTQEEAVNIG